MLLDELEADPRMSVAKLETIYRRLRSRKNFPNELAEAVASGSPALQRAGASLLRRWAPENDLPAPAWDVILSGLPGVQDWVARLKLCQTLVEVPRLWASDPAPLAEFVRRCARDDNVFVRAWAVSAGQTLAEVHPHYRPEARRWLARARRDPAKSMQARLRQLERR